MSMPSRRQCLRLAAAAAGVSVPPIRQSLAQPPTGRNRNFGPQRERDRDRASCTLSIGTYSLKPLPLDEAITRVIEIGYDGIEIATQPGFDGEPAKLTTERRTE